MDKSYKVITQKCTSTGTKVYEYGYKSVRVRVQKCTSTGTINRGEKRA